MCHTHTRTPTRARTRTHTHTRARTHTHTHTNKHIHTHQHTHTTDCRSFSVEGAPKLNARVSGRSMDWTTSEEMKRFVCDDNQVPETQTPTFFRLETLPETRISKTDALDALGGGKTLRVCRQEFIWPTDELAPARRPTPSRLQSNSTRCST